MLRVFGDGGINWNWYLAADLHQEQRTAHVYYYDRWHKYEHRGSGHPANAEWNVGFAMMEDDKRMLYGIKVNGVEYLVVNPANVFSYHDMSVYTAE